MSRGLPLAQFQSLCGLSDAALCYLLRENKLPCHLDPQLGLLIDVHDVRMQELITAITARCATPAPRNAELLAERLGQVVASKVSEMREEAVRLVLERRGNS